MSLHVFTDDRLLVVAANVVPLDSVPVEVVQHCHAGLGLTVLLNLFSVVRLRSRGAETSSAGPVMEGGTIGWTETSLVGRPEPPVDVLWEEVGAVATIKVTETTGGPEVRNVAIDESLHPIVFLLGFERHKIHATLPAVVPGVEPIPLGILHIGIIVLPGEPVEMAVELLNPTL